MLPITGWKHCLVWPSCCETERRDDWRKKSYLTETKKNTSKWTTTTKKTSYWIMGRIVLIEDCCNAVFKHIHGHENTWSCCPWNERVHILRMNIIQTSQLRNQHFAWELSPSKSEQHHVESCSPFDPMQNSAPCALHGQKVASRERLQAAYTVLTVIPALLWDWSIHLGERDLLSSGYASAISLKG